MFDTVGLLNTIGITTKADSMGSGKVSLRGVCFREWLAMKQRKARPNQSEKEGLSRSRKSNQQGLEDVNDNKPIVLPNIAITNSKQKVVVGY